MNSQPFESRADPADDRRPVPCRSIWNQWRSRLALAALVVSLFAAAGCDGFFPAQTKVGPPDDHTDAQGRGTMHKKGSEHPFRKSAGCTDSKCHQSDLRGGLAEVDGRPAEAPSCYQCHGKNWDDEDEDDDIPAPVPSHSTTQL